MPSDFENTDEPMEEIPDGDALEKSVSEVGASIISEYLTPGEKFGDYQVLQCLNFGILGGIYRMQHIIKFNEVCMAVLPQAVTGLEGFQERFESQATLLTHLEHQNIAAVTGYEVIKDQPCLIMEPLEGVNLYQYMEKVIEKKLRAAGALDRGSGGSSRGQVLEYLPDQAFGLPTGEVKEILKQTIAGLSAAHGAEIFHYSLDPEKLVRMEDGTIKIIGLGLVDIVGKEFVTELLEVEMPPVTIGPRKLIINSPDTFNPELRKGEPMEVRSDIHSLGLCGYFLVTGHKPTAEKIPASKYSAAIQPGWDEVTGKCLADQPEDRYPNLKTLLSDVERVDKIAVTKVEEDTSIGKQIEKIPVPEQLRKKLGTKKLQYFRLGIIGLFAVLIIGLATLFFNIIFQEGEASQGPVVKRIREGQDPMLSMTVKPPQAKVVFTGQGQSSFIVTDGVLKVVMPKGDYTVKVAAKDYLPRTSNITVEREALKLPIALKPAWGILEVKSTPGARLLARRGKDAPVDLGLVPENGVLRAVETLHLGKWELEIGKENYETTSLADIVLPLHEEVKLEAMLSPLPGKMRVLSQPEGAIVSIGGRLLGKTPLPLQDIPAEKEIVVSVSLRGYRTREKSITLPAGFDDVLDFGILERQAGAIETSITLEGAPLSEEEAEKIITRIAGQTLSGKVGFIPDVLAGEQVLEIEHPDYKVWRKSLHIVDQRKTTVKADLLPKPGILTITLDKAVPFQLVADGKLIKGEQNRFLLAADKPHQIEVRIKDHKTAKRSMRFKPNEKRAWTLKAVPIPGPKQENNWFVPYVGTDMVWVPAGEFRMGSPPMEQARLPEEGPQTTMAFSVGFWIGKYEITQAQYRFMMGGNPSEFKGLKNPVERVSWRNAVEFCRKVNAQEKAAGRVPEGYEYRLPTQAEWEYACRAGTTTPYHFGERADPTMGNFKEGYPREYTGNLPQTKEIYGTTEIGSYPPNAWKIYDMHGNVRELCYDFFNSRYPGGRQTDWHETRVSKDRVYRGGGWEDFADRARSASRVRIKPDIVSNSMGFRLSLGLEIKR